MKKYCQEIKSLRKLQNSKTALLHMDEFFVENGSFYIISESMGMTLGRWRATVPHFNEETAKEVAKTLLAGVSYMHSQHVIHRDIKPHNVVFQHDGLIPTLKIIDFGLSRVLLSSNDWRRTFVGSIGYIA